MTGQQFINKTDMTAKEYSAWRDWMAAHARTPMHWINSVIETLYIEWRLSEEDIDNAEKELMRTITEYRRAK